MRESHVCAITMAMAFATLSALTASAQYTQQGPKLVGTGGATVQQHKGWSVALSADGSTALMGANGDNGYVGAVYVFTRAGGVWTQQGNKLNGSTSTAGDNLGWSCALSPDGNTALVGAYNDGGSKGAAWVFVRSGASWTQQGDKLVGAYSGGALVQQGYSVALSADGNTAAVGGPRDASDAGAVWIFTRSGTTWTQQGGKLVGSGAVGNAWQGNSVALSADGNTLLVGGYAESSDAGAAWVFTRAGGTWTQQGPKLVGSGAVGKAGQGRSVALSADGNTAFLGGPSDNSSRGAVWVFTRSAGVWTQQGSKIAGPEAYAFIGQSVAVSADANTLVTGGGSGVGAAFVFRRSGSTWTQFGNKLVGSDTDGDAQQGQAVAISDDASTIMVGGPNDRGGTASDPVGAAWVYTNQRATIYVPSLAHSAGVPPTFWKTRLELHNPGLVQSRFSVLLLKRDQDNSSAQYVNLYLDPGTSVLYTDALADLFGFTGAATLRTIVTAGDLIISANTYNDQPSGTFGQYIPGLPDTEAISENQEVRIVHLSYSTSSSSGYRTNIGVVSACAIPITVTVDLYTKAGARLGTRTFNLLPYESEQETNSFSKVTTSAVDSGYAIVKSTTAGARYFAYGSLVENRTGDPIYIPAQ